MRLRGGFVDTRPLRASPAFRRLWVGNSASVLGGQLTMVAVLAQVWELTGSSVAVGAIGIAQAVPMVIFGLIGGTLADAVDRRRLVLLTTIGQVVSTGLLAAQAIAGMSALPMVLGLVAIQAACSGLGAPARKTFVPRLLPEHLVGAGIALTHLSFQVAMLAGPALAGLLTARWGAQTCYVIDTLTFGLALYGVLRLPAMRPAEDTDRPGARATLRGWRFIAGRPVVRAAFLTDTLATVMAMPIALFPAINAERFGEIHRSWACSCPRSPLAAPSRARRPAPSLGAGDPASSCWPRPERGAWGWRPSVSRSRSGWPSAALSSRVPPTRSA